MGFSRLRAWAPALGLAVVLSTSSHAAAATYVPRTLAQLVQRSDATVLGHPVAQRAFWHQGRIVTEVTVQLDECWHGALQPRQEVAVLTLGGEIGELAQRVEGAAALPRYGRVVLHLQRVARGYVPTAMAQGVWLVDELYGSRAAVHQQAPYPTAALALRPSAARAHGPQDLASLRAAVQEAALVRP